jgi:hypothetical protein
MITPFATGRGLTNPVDKATFTEPRKNKSNKNII